MWQSFLQENRNIKISYLLVFVSEFYFPIAVWVFYYTHFMDFKHIALLTAIQTTIVILMQVPTGAFADMFGRKTATLFSFALFSGAMLLASFANAFWMFALIEIAKGTSIALYSGALEALVYDSLKQAGQESHYDRVNSNLRSLEWIALFLSAIIGGFLYTLNFRAPYIAQFLLYIPATLICFLLVEPKIDSAKSDFLSFVRQNIAGFKELFPSFAAAKTTLLLITVSMGFYVTANFLGISQARQYGLDSRGVGILFGVGYVFSAFASQLFPKLKNKFGTTILIFATAIFLLFTLITANFVGAVFGGALIIFRIASSSIFNNSRSSLINTMVGSKNRATAISALTLLYEFPYAILAYFMGSYIDKSSPNSFALILGLALGAILLLQWTIFFVLPHRSSK